MQVGQGEPSQQTMRNAALLADQNLADLSGNILVRATVLHLQTAFVEFAVKEVFKLVLPDRVIPRRTRLNEDLISPLKEAGAFTDFPAEYLQDVFKHREAIRNNFAHGDWFELAKAVQGLDLGESFRGDRKAFGTFPSQPSSASP